MPLIWVMKVSLNVSSQGQLFRPFWTSSALRFYLSLYICICICIFILLLLLLQSSSSSSSLSSSVIVVICLSMFLLNRKGVNSDENKIKCRVPSSLRYASLNITDAELFDSKALVSLLNVASSFLVW